MAAQRARCLNLDPRTKIVLWALSSVVVFASLPKASALAVMVIYGALLLYDGKAGTALGLLASYVAIRLLCLRVLPLLPTGLSVALATLGYAGMMFPVAIGVVYLCETTPVGQLTAALRALHVPETAMVSLATTLRYLPAVGHEFQQVRQAMRLRGVQGLTRKAESLYVPLLLGVADSAEDLASSVAVRGIDDPAPKTSWREVGLGWKDLAVITVFALVLVAGLSGTVA